MSVCANVERMSSNGFGAAVHVVLDDHLHAELRMPAREPDEQHEQHGRPALVNPRVNGGVVERRQRDERHDKRDGERDERDRRHSLHPPVVHALLRRALAENPSERSAQAHASPLFSDERDEQDHGEHHRHGDDDPGARLRLALLEAAARIPNEVPDSRHEVIAERKGEPDIDKLEEWVRQHHCCFVVRLRSVGERHQPDDERYQAEAECNAREAIEEGRNNRVLELVHAGVRRQWSIRHQCSRGGARYIYRCHPAPVSIVQKSMQRPLRSQSP